jgi:hypothetical protein
MEIYFKTPVNETETLLEIIKTVDLYPNDQELGKKIRKIIDNIKKTESNEYIDNSHEKGY